MLHVNSIPLYTCRQTNLLLIVPLQKLFYHRLLVPTVIIYVYVLPSATLQ